MAEEKKSVFTLTKFMSLFATGLVVFFASEIWRAYERTNDSISAVEKRLERIEADQSKWGTLTELHNKVVLIDRELYRFQGIYLYAADREKALPSAKPEPGVPIPMLPLPLPVPIPGESGKVAPPAERAPEKLLPPDELFKNPEDYRRMQQHKFPLDPEQRKR